IGSDMELASAFSNLITNAIKYTPKGGTITMGWHDDGVQGYFTVEDTGIGIDLDKFNELIIDNKIFSTTGTEGEEGTGLGLILCKELIDKNNGTFRAALNADGGTSFFFTLPLIHTNKNKPSNASSNLE
ncbi:MAG: ATP-binding protein, partial [Bacteroidales bacterium]